MPRLPASLTVVANRRRITLKIGDSFPFTDKHSYCVKISPSLKKGASIIEYIYFSSFTFSTNKIIIDESFLSLLPNMKYILTVVNPVMVPNPNLVNKRISGEIDPCFIHLFRRMDNNPVYIDSFPCFWKYASTTLNFILENAGLNYSNISIGLVQNANQFPSEFLTIQQFFSDKSNGRKIMVLCCEFNDSLMLECEGVTVSTHILPVLPKMIAFMASKRLKLVKNDSIKTLLRKILVVTANSGVLVDLLDSAKLKFGNNTLNSSNFEQINLNWENSVSFEIESNLYLLPKEGFKNLLASSNEATFGGLFWTAALNAALIPGCRANHLRLVQEWTTGRVLPKFPKRRVDYAGLLNCFPVDKNESDPDFYPILLVEYSKETVPHTNYHKDFGKTGCLISACCLRLAKKLIELNFKPELARTYGLLVGGTGARLMVAHPVIRLIGQEYEIHINISSSPSWKIDLLARNIVANDRETVPTESINPALNVPNLEGFDFSNDSDDNLIHVGPEESENVRSSKTKESIRRINALIADGVDDSVLSQIGYIGQIISERSHLICTATKDTSNRRFKTMSSRGFLPSARLDSYSNTPDERQVKIVNSNEDLEVSSPSTNRKASRRTTKCAIELQIYSEASVIFPGLLPRIYDIKDSLESGFVEYLMELLEPFATESTGIHGFFDKKTANDILLATSKFMLDSLFQMHLLHEHLKLVHADISPSTIMYSTIDKIWKLVEFHHAVPENQTEINIRTSRTNDFIAPEALESGKFTAACDVWSLGEIAINFLMPSLTFGVYCEEDNCSHSDSDNDEYPGVEELCDSVVNCINRMISTNPEDRPSVIEAIKLFYSVISSLESDISDSDLVIQGSNNLIRLVDLKSSATEPSTHSVSIKRIETLISEKESMVAEPPRIQ